MIIDFGPPASASGSVSLKYGIFHHQEKSSMKDLDFYCFVNSSYGQLSEMCLCLKVYRNKMLTFRVLLFVKTVSTWPFFILA
jgi:hypothetical protein